MKAFQMRENNALTSYIKRRNQSEETRTTLVNEHKEKKGTFRKGILKARGGMEAGV